MEPRSVAGWRGVATATLILALTAGHAAAPGPPEDGITVAWDANPEPVQGYLVHVRAEWDGATETFDVGQNLSFAHTNVVAAVRYYFAVSAYNAGPLEGPRSGEVSTVYGGWEFFSLAGAPPSSRAKLRATGLGPVTALTSVGDGRLLLIENSRQVRVIDADALVVEPALTADEGAELTHVVVDPSFSRTGHVFVGVTEARRDGTREFRIVRYRELQNTLGEGAAVVTGLSLSAAEDRAPFTVDHAGRIYVAMPAVRDGRRDPYAGHILRFNANGSLSSDSRGGSPIIAHGYDHPIALDWDGHTLWVVGVDATRSHVIARLAPDSPAQGPWPQSPVVTRLPADASTDLRIQAFDAGHPRANSEEPRAVAFLDSRRRLHVMTPDDVEDGRGVDTMTWNDGETPVAVSVGPQRKVYVAVERTGRTFEVVELTLKR